MAHYYRNRETRIAAQKARQLAVRHETIEAYGGKCVCCDETMQEFLTIDHIRGDGTQHRREENLHGGATMYRWLRKYGFPKDNFQLLCFNCNHAKHIYGTCPHQTVKLVVVK